MVFEAGIGRWMINYSLILIYVILCTIVLSTDAKTTGTREKKFGCVLPKEPLFGTFVFNNQRRSLRYECYEGFYLNAVSQYDRKCRGGRWTGKPLDCVRLRSFKHRCNDLRNPENGRVIVEGTLHGDQARFLCNQGYHIEGSERVTCQGGRYWDGIIPICRSHRTAFDIAMNFKDRVIHTLSAATVQSESGIQGRLSPGKNGLDIMFLVDTSSSIGEGSLNMSKNFMHKLVDLFGVSSDANGAGNETRFGMITFSGEANLRFEYNHKDARSKEQVKALISETKNTGGGTNFVNALAQVQLQNLMHERPGATRAVFIITDAEDAVDKAMDKTRRFEIIDLANAVKEDGVEIFAIGVGKSVDKSLIADIASDPYIEHVFYLDNFKDLNEIGDIIAEKNIDYGQCGVSGNTATAHGSQKSKKGALPWLGWLTVFADGATWTCGGSLLCDRWFLTTATCVTYLQSNGTVVKISPNMIGLVLGDDKLYENDQTEQYPIIQDVLVHDNYAGEVIEGTGVREYDIALLDLGKKAGNESIRPKLQKYLRPLCFPIDNESVALANVMMQASMSFPDTHSGLVAGWGHAPDSSSQMKLNLEVLMQIEQSVTKDKICRKMYPGLDKEMFFCVGNGFGGSDTCRGDIGGPYMVKMQNKLYSGLGLALDTRDCHRSAGFSVFLNLLHPSITEWITPILDGCNRYKTLREVKMEEEKRAKEIKQKKSKKKDKGRKKNPKSKDGKKKPGLKKDGQKKPGLKKDGQKKPGLKKDGQKKPGLKKDGKKKPGSKKDGKNENKPNKNV